MSPCSSNTMLTFRLDTVPTVTTSSLSKWLFHQPKARSRCWVNIQYGRLAQPEATTSIRTRSVCFTIFDDVPLWCVQEEEMHVVPDWHPDVHWQAFTYHFLWSRQQSCITMPQRALVNNAWKFSQCHSRCFYCQPWYGPPSPHQHLYFHCCFTPSLSSSSGSKHYMDLSIEGERVTKFSMKTSHFQASLLN